MSDSYIDYIASKLNTEIRANWQDRVSMILN